MTYYMIYYYSHWQIHRISCSLDSLSNFGLNQKEHRILSCFIFIFYVFVGGPIHAWPARHASTPAPVTSMHAVRLSLLFLDFLDLSPNLCHFFFFFFFFFFVWFFFLLVFVILTCVWIHMGVFQNYGQQMTILGHLQIQSFWGRGAGLFSMSHFGHCFWNMPIHMFQS